MRTRSGIPSVTQEALRALGAKGGGRKVPGIKFSIPDTTELKQTKELESSRNSSTSVFTR